MRNYLVASNHVDSDVQLLTETEMNLKGITADIYRRLLDFVRPIAEQVARLED
ncbi:hypothetical protein [Coxiella-like endosymbiont]|uniref:hypothetical protein n=1 Tax=Coxiella-like endosymbiont TaxID=1592897 RepID=UPI00272CA397|nr:hypothetical protein [Coxiella-like endosymbiont]